MSNCWKVLTRKKILDAVQTEQTQLARVLNTFDLTALGVGSTLGVGVYVLAGHVARDTAGPSVILSFLIAAIASVFAGLCYAEFGARTPRAGSAYIYSYVSIGELVAFIIGWNLILEYVIGSASVARGLSVYLDTLINNTLQNTFREIAPIDVKYMSSYFDFFSFGLPVVLAIALAFGLKESSIVNNIFTTLNIAVVLFVIIAGSFYADPENWNLPANNTVPGTGSGGFFPFGIEGMIKGAATCFYGFVGFDCIATTGEEVKNPQKAIPISILLSLTIIFLAYFGTATIITLMVPFYLQDINAPIPHAFAEVGFTVAKWIVSIGGIFGLCASLFGAMFPLPRIVYAMASDGIIFKFLGQVNQKFHTPVVGTLLAGLLTGLMAALFELKQLVNMMSIGTLLAYTLVAACVLILRYRRDEEGMHNIAPPLEGYSEGQSFERSSDNLVSEDSDSITLYQKVTCCGLTKQIFNFQGLEFPTKTSELLVTIEVFLYCVLCLLMGLCAMYLVTPIAHGKIWAITVTSVIGLFLLLLLLSLTTQPVSHKQLRFKVPLVPLIPALSILVNVYLMLMLDFATWIRFGVWMIIGMPMYFISVFSCSGNSNKFSVKCANNLTHSQTNGYKSRSLDKLNGHINKGYLEEMKGSEDMQQQQGNSKGNGYVVPFVGSYTQKDENSSDENNKQQNIDEQNNDISNKIQEKSNEPKKLKPKAPLPPTPEPKDKEDEILVKRESDNASVSNVLAILDEVLLQEEKTVPQNIPLEDQAFSPSLIEDSSLLEEAKSLKRNSSFDSVSLTSNLHREESVVALVHQEDTKSIRDSRKTSNTSTQEILEKRGLQNNQIVNNEEELNSDETKKKMDNDLDDTAEKQDGNNEKYLSGNEKNKTDEEKLQTLGGLNEGSGKLDHIEGETVPESQTKEGSDNNNSKIGETTQATSSNPEEKAQNLNELIKENGTVDARTNEIESENETNIPPAPPFDSNLFEQSFKTVPRIPRVNLKQNHSFSSMQHTKPHFNDTKANLKELADDMRKRSNVNGPIDLPPSPVQELPSVPADYLQPASRSKEEEKKEHHNEITPDLNKSKEVEDLDDNITFGSEQHKKIASKLEHLFSKSMGVPPPKKLTKPEIPQENDINHSSVPGTPDYNSLEFSGEIPAAHVPAFKRSSQEVLGEEVDIKTKLNEIFRRSLRPPAVVQPKSKEVVKEENPINESDQNSQSKKETYNSEHVMHKQKMNDTLKSIRLRKVDSFKNT